MVLGGEPAAWVHWGQHLEEVPVLQSVVEMAVPAGVACGVDRTQPHVVLKERFLPLRVVLFSFCLLRALQRSVVRCLIPLLYREKNVRSGQIQELSSHDIITT